MLIGKKTRASVLLDLTRGLAALLVALGHWRNLLFVDYPQLTAHRRLAAPFYGVTSCGHQAVIVFFVLSGYLVGGNVLAVLKRGSWSWIRYASHRLTRLWVVLIPGLLLGLACDEIRLHLERGRQSFSIASGAVPHALGIKVFFANAFFLQGIHAPMFGSNVVLWSLANEFWYYALFPLGLLVFHRRSSTGGRLIYGLLFLLCAFFVRGTVLYQFPIWLAGVVLAKLPALKLGKSVPVIATLLYVPQVFFFSKFALFARSAMNSDYLFAGATFLFIWVLLSIPGEEKPHRINRLIRTLAGFSFTLYVVHIPALALIASITLRAGRWTPTAVHLIEGAALFCLVLAGAFGVALLTEFRTETWRIQIERHLDVKNSSGVLGRLAVKRIQRPA